jgi:1-acyl-sn-glycerol-3-phosphate acyltransferase
MSERPPEVHILLHKLAVGLFRLVGWRAEGALPNLPKMVLVAAPHTSNWDGLIMFMSMPLFRMRLRWIGKHTLFRPPYGVVLRALGGIAVERKAPTGAVRQIAAAFASNDTLVLLISPEGTRRQVERWKTGFYYIAQSAHVPIVLAYVDYKRRVVGIGPVFEMTGDLDADLAAIQRYYADKVGKHPQRMTVDQPPEEGPS